MEIVNDMTLRELAIRLPLCLGKGFGVLSERDLEIKTLLNEGFNLVPFWLLPSTSCATADGLDILFFASLEDPVSQRCIGADRRVTHIVGFVNWMLDRGYYNGSLTGYFRKKVNDLKEYDNIVFGY